jgi:hypothetical protein
MTQPTPPPPPAVVGTNPRNADEVNGLTGTHLRSFLNVRAMIEQDESFMGATDLTAAPYYFTEDQQTQIKSAVTTLNTALQAVDLTFISRVVGMA